MELLQIDIEYRVIIGISAMVLLFASFLIVFISSQRKKLQYLKNMHALHQEQEQVLTEQNQLLEKRVEERTAELMHQKEALQLSLRDLKAAQLQLVQREKMASLGELTAGIAHEIQNPLNFVNNFSDINVELVKEMLVALQTGDTTEAQVLANDIIDNEQKISQHGKRADAIVKGMLQHSRSSSGKKEPVDINALVDEYFRLSYYGIRSKDKTFTALIKTNYDEKLPPVNIIPQDIGRVILNLLNNAFYSVHKKKAKMSADMYEPTVSISTKQVTDAVEIRIWDNGTGIPESLLSKVYQPFFTTKPTGEGTGLGLSLSYDIIKAHGGELKIETKEGEYAQFTILLPA